MEIGNRAYYFVEGPIWRDAVFVGFNPISNQHILGAKTRIHVSFSWEDLPGGKNILMYPVATIFCFFTDLSYSSESKRSIIQSRLLRSRSPKLGAKTRFFLEIPLFYPIGKNGANQFHAVFTIAGCHCTKTPIPFSHTVLGFTVLRRGLKGSD